MRCLTTCFLTCLLACSSVFAHAADSVLMKVVLATFRLENPKSTATSFVVFRQIKARRGSPSGRKEYLLVTAKHVLTHMQGERARLEFRKRDASGNYRKEDVVIPIRKRNQKLWVEHPKADIAVLPLKLPSSVLIPALPLDVLATEKQWKRFQLSPGDLVRCVGFPHASRFHPIEAGFPLVRLGCLAGYPNLPVAKHPTFLVAYNTFEGDSGAPVCWVGRTDHGPELLVLGLVQGQHFLKEQYKLIYESGAIRKRLGIAVAVHAQLIRETIEKVGKTAVRQ